MKYVEMKYCWFVLLLSMASTQAAQTQSGAQSSESRIQRLEDQHERELLTKMEERQTTRENELKDSTPECRFWKLQQKKSPSPKAAEKIKQFCSAKPAS